MYFMITVLLTLGLKKLAPVVGNVAFNKIKEGIFGKETTLGDIKDSIKALDAVISSLPKETYKHFVEQEFWIDTTQAEHNIIHNHIGGLLDFLDDSRKESYWGITNKLCLLFTAVSAVNMEKSRLTPENLDLGISGSIKNSSNSALKTQRGITDYLEIVSAEAAILTIYVFTLQRLASEALLMMGRVKPGEDYYKECRARLDSKTTKKYVPISGDQTKAGVGGLLSILAPAIAEAPRQAVGKELALIYESAVDETKKKSKPVALQSYRFRTSAKRFLKWNGRGNPFTSSDKSKFWDISVSRRNICSISTIYTYDEKRKYLYIGFQKYFYDHPDADISGQHYKLHADVIINSKSVSQLWKWTIIKVGSNVVHMFEYDQTSLGLNKKMISTTWSIIRNHFAPGIVPGNVKSQFELIT